jgi:hypothetical protein
LYYRSFTNAALNDNSKTWKKIAFADDYLPLGGGTMTGAIHSQSIIPTSNTTYYLGSSSKQFNTTYTRHVDTTSGYNLRLNAAGTEHINMLSGNVNTTANIIPTKTATYNLGTDALKWANVYATTFNGILNGSINAPVIGANADDLNNFVEIGKVKFGTFSSLMEITDTGMTNNDGLIISHGFASGSNNKYGYQLALDDNGYNISFRYINNNTWAPWKKLAFASDIPTAAADIGAAPKSHKHDTTDITSGTLSITYGGTGLSSLPIDHIIIGTGLRSATSQKIVSITNAEIDDMFEL